MNLVVAVHGTERTRRERLAAIPWFGETFRTQVFFGFMLISLITAALGIYGWLGLNDAARTVTDSYEHPAAATDAARAAQLAFARLKAEQQRLASAMPAGGGGQDWSGLVTVLGEALKTVEKTALSPATAAAAGAAAGAFGRWIDLPRFPLGNTIDWGVQTGALEDRLDQLVALALLDGNREKTVAARWLGNYALVSWAEVFGAVLVSLLLTSVMVRRITQPLSDAVGLAVRITGGDFATPIPQTVKGEAGALLRSMRVMQDSIRRMMDHEKLQRRSAQTRLVDALEGADEAVALVDEENRIVLANSQVTSFFPASAGRLLEGTSFLDLLSFAEQASVKPAEADAQPVSGAAAAADDLQQFLRLAVGEVQLLDGRWLRVSHNPTRDGGFFVLWSDITAMKDREARLHAAKREAEIANAAKSRFLSTVGHELRTPLNAIIGFSELMDSRAFGPLGSPNYQDFVAHILKGGRQLLDAINGILDLARSDAGTLTISPDVVDLHRLLEDCARQTRERCALAGLDFALDLPDELELWGDPARLRQMIVNLLSNAVKFTPAGGSVRMTASRQGDGWVEIGIADTGIGMRPEDIPFALAPFNQIDGELNRNFEGTGLGLPLAKALIDLHRGTLSLDSAKGFGTTVTIRLPGEEATASAQAA